MKCIAVLYNAVQCSAMQRSVVQEVGQAGSRRPILAVIKGSISKCPKCNEGRIFVIKDWHIHQKKDNIHNKSASIQTTLVCKNCPNIVIPIEAKQRERSTDLYRHPNSGKGKVDHFQCLLIWGIKPPDPL